MATTLFVANYTWYSWSSALYYFSNIVCSLGTCHSIYCKW